MRREAARRLACIAGAMAAVLCAAPANAAAGPRIFGGQAAAAGEYPAHGYLELDTADGFYVCGGTLVSNRQFLTAAHCATEPDTTTPLPASAFRVTLGKVDRSDFTPADRYAVIQNQVDASFDYTGPGGDIPENDVALLTLATPAPARLEPLRLIEAGETGRWKAGETATIVGWGRTESQSSPDALQEASVPMVSDARCGDVWDPVFRAASMVCAGGGTTDTCDGDSGGPLMVSDGVFPVLAGLTSWGESACATQGVPGVYTRLGASALNSWVRARVPMARARVSDSTVGAGDAVTFSVTTSHPGIGPFTSFAWDFDSNGTTDASGPATSVAHAYPADGRYVARVRATGAGPDTATAKVAVQVGSPQPAPTPTPTAEPAPGPAAPVPPTAPVPRPAASAHLATILTTGRPKVRHGRFFVRVQFSRGAPSGTAVIEVIRKHRVVGIGRTHVLRSGTRRVRVKLTPTGRRLLRAHAGRLRVQVRVRVGRRLLRSKPFTLRRSTRLDGATSRR